MKTIEELNRTIQLESNNAKAYFERGNAHCCKGEYDKAIEDYTHAIQFALFDEKENYLYRLLGEKYVLFSYLKFINIKTLI